jgi:hypothetical protein
VADDRVATEPTCKRQSRLANLLGFNEDFTRMDRIVSGGVVAWCIFWLAVVLGGTIWNLIRPWPAGVWVHYWLITGIVLPMLIATITLVWFGIGGILDMRSFFNRLSSLRRDAADDGSVLKAADEHSEQNAPSPT